MFSFLPDAIANIVLFFSFCLLELHCSIPKQIFSHRMTHVKPSSEFRCLFWRAMRHCTFCLGTRFSTRPSQIVWRTGTDFKWHMETQQELHEVGRRCCPPVPAEKQLLLTPAHPLLGWRILFGPLSAEVRIKARG